MAVNESISQNELKTLLDYDPLTGEFTWKLDSSFTVFKGDRAGTAHNRGYWQIQINNRRYLAHRLAWLWVYGMFPKGEIDHINRNKLDNRIENLRDVNGQLNLYNTGKKNCNTTGYKGVTFIARLGKWQAQIRTNGRKIYLGTFDTPERADISHRIAEYFREKYYDHTTTQSI